MVELRDNGDVRQVQMWRRVADYRDSGDVGQQGQRQHRYGKMDAAAEETRGR